MQEWGGWEGVQIGKSPPSYVTPVNTQYLVIVFYVANLFAYGHASEN